MQATQSSARCSTVVMEARTSGASCCCIAWSSQQLCTCTDVRGLFMHTCDTDAWRHCMQVAAWLSRAAADDFSKPDGGGDKLLDGSDLPGGHPGLVKQEIQKWLGGWQGPAAAAHSKCTSRGSDATVAHACEARWLLHPCILSTSACEYDVLPASLATAPHQCTPVQPPLCSHAAGLAALPWLRRAAWQPGRHAPARPAVGWSGPAAGRRAAGVSLLDRQSHLRLCGPWVWQQGRRCHCH